VTPTAGSVRVGGRRYRDLDAPMREVGALLEGSSAGLAPGVAALVVAAWLAVFLGGARAVFERRDA
jgi:ABC-2 type transport system ATP-binding protein